MAAYFVMCPAAFAWSIVGLNWAAKSAEARHHHESIQCVRLFTLWLPRCLHDHDDVYVDQGEKHSCTAVAGCRSRVMLEAAPCANAPGNDASRITCCPDRGPAKETTSSYFCCCPLDPHSRAITYEDDYIYDAGVTGAE